LTEKYVIKNIPASIAMLATAAPANPKEDTNRKIKGRPIMDIKTCIRE